MNWHRKYLALLKMCPSAVAVVVVVVVIIIVVVVVVAVAVVSQILKLNS